MALFLGLTELNAASFESGVAAAGLVLTADGDGGAGWVRGGVPYLGDIAVAGGEPPTQASAEDAFVRVMQRASVLGDVACVIDTSGELPQTALIVRFDAGTPSWGYYPSSIILI